MSQSFSLASHTELSFRGKNGCGENNMVSHFGTPLERKARYNYLRTVNNKAVIVRVINGKPWTGRAVWEKWTYFGTLPFLERQHSPLNCYGNIAILIPDSPSLNGRGNGSSNRSLSRTLGMEQSFRKGSIHWLCSGTDVGAMHSLCQQFDVAGMLVTPNSKPLAVQWFSPPGCAAPKLRSTLRY